MARTFPRLDGRTRAARRRRALIDSYVEALGGPAALTPIKQQEVEQAATLTVIAEVAQAKFLEGSELVTADDLVRATNAADRAVRRLNIKAPERRQSRLAQILAGAE